MRSLLIVGLLASGTAACSIEATTSPDGRQPAQVVEGLEFEAETLVLESFPVQLETRVKVTNTTGQRVETYFPDGCVVQLRVYRSAERTGEPAWDQAGHYGCYMAIVPLELGPGESETHSAPRISAREILGDSLPEGRYYLAAHVRPEGQAVQLPAGDVLLAQ